MSWNALTLCVYREFFEGAASPMAHVPDMYSCRLRSAKLSKVVAITLSTMIVSVSTGDSKRKAVWMAYQGNKFS